MPRPVARPLADRRRQGNLAVGCIIAVVIAIALLAVVGFVLYRTFMKQAGTGFHMIMVGTVKNAGLAQEQQTALTEHFDQMLADYRNGDVTLTQFIAAHHVVITDPVLVFATVEHRLRAAADLTDEQKAEALRQVRRYIRGIVEGKIDPNVAPDPLGAISEPNPMYPDAPKLVDNPAGEKLSALAAELKQRADAAAVPDEPFEFDIVARIKQAVDKARADPDPVIEGIQNPQAPSPPAPPPSPIPPSPSGAQAPKTDTGN